VCTKTSVEIFWYVSFISHAVISLVYIAIMANYEGNRVLHYYLASPLNNVLDITQGGRVFLIINNYLFPFGMNFYYKHNRKPSKNIMIYSLIEGI
ncbi:hypothetical protein L9F63_019996, partial [Diploptera punctata]